MRFMGQSGASLNSRRDAPPYFFRPIKNHLKLQRRGLLVILFEHQKAAICGYIIGDARNVQVWPFKKHVWRAGLELGLGRNLGCHPFWSVAIEQFASIL